MKWIEEHCPDAPYLVKADDDMFIDPFRLRRYFTAVETREGDLSQMRHFYCYHWKYGTVIRDQHRKHFLDWNTFPGRRFPAYCSGSAFILTTQISQVIKRGINNTTVSAVLKCALFF